MNDILQEKVDEFDRVVAEMRATFIKKNNDYGSSNIGDLGEKGIFCRIWDKTSRLKQLIWLSKEVSVDNESVLDTLMDLANYSIITIIFLRGKWK